MNNHGEDLTPKEAQQMQLIITVKPNGSISVEGPINDKVLCYGLLEAAKDAVKQHVDQSSLLKANGNGGFFKRFR